MQPAEARNYFSASYFSRDILIPSFFSSFIAVQVIFIFPNIIDLLKAELISMNVFIFLVCVYFFFAISVTSTNLLFRAFSILNRNALSRLLIFTDYQVHYDRAAEEIDNILQDTKRVALIENNDTSICLNHLSVREKVNLLLRVVERTFPEGTIMLARLYGFVAVTSALIVGQIVLVGVLTYYSNWFGVAVCAVCTVFLVAAQMGLIRAAASTELDVLRAAQLIMRLDEKAQTHRSSSESK